MQHSKKQKPGITRALLSSSPCAGITQIRLYGYFLRFFRNTPKKENNIWQKKLCQFEHIGIGLKHREHKANNFYRREHERTEMTQGIAHPLKPFA